MMKTSSYDNAAGLAALLAGIGGPLYSVAFVFLFLFGLAPALGLTLSAFFLLLGALLTVVVIVALYQHLRETDAAFALLGLVIALAGAFGAAVHGGYDLANQLHPPSPAVLTSSNYPSAVDPRGLATFGFAGVGLCIFSWLMSRSQHFPPRLATLGYAAGILNVIIYLARLIILTPTNPIVLVVAGLTGLIVNPAFYIWLGLTLRRGLGR